jgi:hypothetical protein
MAQSLWEEIQNEGWFHEEQDGRVYSCEACGDETYDPHAVIFVDMLGWLCKPCHHEQD